MNEANQQAQAFTEHFVLQLNGVLSLLQRIGGPGLYAKLETKLNSLCELQSWPLKIQQGQLAKIANSVTNISKSAHYESALRLDITRYTDI